MIPLALKMTAQSHLLLLLLNLDSVSPVVAAVSVVGSAIVVASHLHLTNPIRTHPKKMALMDAQVEKMSEDVAAFEIVDDQAKMKKNHLNGMQRSARNNILYSLIIHLYRNIKKKLPRCYFDDFPELLGQD